MPHALHRLPAYLINGIGVALGIGLVQLLAAVLGGPAAVLAATSGAVYAHLADLPNPPRRGWRRVLAAALVGCGVSVGLTLIRSHPLALGVAVGAIGFCSALTLAWGARAGPLSFVGLMAFVFTMASPPPASPTAFALHTAWMVGGAALYLGWSVLVAVAMQPRYRTLALAAVLSSTAHLLRSRAAVLGAGSMQVDGEARLQAWIEQEARLDERLQVARDLLFAALPGELADRHNALLLLALDLRDTLLLGELDLDLLGSDAPATLVRATLGEALGRVADELQAVAEALRLARPLPYTGTPQAANALASLAALQVFPADEERARLVPVLAVRVRHMGEDLSQMQALMHGAPPRTPLAREELQLFASVEGWPLAALRPHASLRSPVLRHALRLGAALACAYAIGLALPWASHPYWLVLSVAVVLRGSLEQTLSRRNARVAGTVVGCVLVLGLTQVRAEWLAAGVFLASAGLAHAFVTTRYGVTSAAAAVMALLQAQMAHALTSFSIVERIADTVLGAALAWAFSYVLPSWERVGLPRLVARVTRALAALADEALQLRDAAAPDVPLRLARREAYAALDGLAAAAQRSRVEPERVRVPLADMAALLVHGHALLAHVAAVKLMLTRRGAELDRAPTEAALRAAREALRRSLAGAGTPEPVPPADAALGRSALPATLPAEALLPWLERRLQGAVLAADRVARAAADLRAAAGRGPAARVTSPTA